MFELSLQELTEIVGGTLRFGTLPPLGGGDEPVRRAVTDSRHVQPGDVFWTLPATRLDGYCGGQHAMMQGAVAVVDERRALEPWAGSSVIDVDSAVHALEQLARWIRYHYSGTVIVVERPADGSSALDCLQPVLAARGRGTVCRNAAGAVPDVAIAMLAWTELDDYAVLETSLADRYELARILDLCDPRIVAITSPRLVCATTAVDRDSKDGWLTVVRPAASDHTVFLVDSVTGGTGDRDRAGNLPTGVRVAVAVGEQLGIAPADVLALPGGNPSHPRAVA